MVGQLKGKNAGRLVFLPDGLLSEEVGATILENYGVLYHSPFVTRALTA